MKIHNTMKILAVIGIIFSFSSPAFAASLSVTINPTTVNFGNVTPDGSSYYAQNSISVKSSNNVDLYVKVSGSFNSSGNTISLQSFRYQFNNSGSYMPFDTSSSLLTANLYKPSQGGHDTFPISYMLTVPTGTNFGSYTTIIIYTALDAGTPPPAVTTTSIAGSSSITGNSSNNNTGSSDMV